MSLKCSNLHRMNEGIQKQSHRIIGLDILRIVLAILILLFHSQIYLKCNFYFLNNFVRMGAIAMTGFMLLSGYSLHLSYSKKDLSLYKNIKVFYIKRLISIMPMYYTVVILYTLYDVLCGTISFRDNIILFPIEALGLQSTFSTLFPYLHNAGTWFISCILLCYFVYPYLQLLFSQLSIKSKLLLLFFLIGILLYSPFVQHAFCLNSIYENPFFRLIEFSIGIIIAQINTSQIQSKFLNILRSDIFIIVISVFFVMTVSIARGIGLPADYMLFNWIAIPFFIVIIMSLGQIRFSFLKSSQAIIYFSGMSFTFYLCQVLPLWDFCKYICTYIGDSNLIKILVSIVVCFLWSIIIHEGIEKPISKFLKQKLL